MHEQNRSFWQKNQALFLIFAVGVIAVFSTLVAMTIKPEEAPRVPAAYGPSETLALPGATTSKEKLGTLLPHATESRIESAAATHKKGGGYLDVQISSLASVANTTRIASTLEASVTALADLDGLEYAWLLPSGVSLDSGLREGMLGRLKKGESQRLNLTISTPLARNERIYLHVYRTVRGEAHGQVTQFNTLDQPMIEREIAEKTRSLKAGVQNGRLPKIHQ